MGIGAFVALVGFSRAFENEWLHMYTSSGIDIAVIQTNFLNSSLDQSLGAKISTVPDVAQVAPMMFNLMDLTPEVNALAYGWLANSFELDSLTMISGRRFRDGQPEVLLGDLLATNLNKQVGDTPSDSGHNVHGHRDLSRRHGIGGRRGHPANRSDASHHQHRGQGDSISCAPSPGA